MWSKKFNEDTMIFKVFQCVRDSNIALFPYELMQRFPGMNESTVRTALCSMSERKLLVRNEEFVRTPNGGYAQLYGINEASIVRRKGFLDEEKSEFPEKFTYGSVAKLIFSTLKESPTGMTPREIADVIGKQPHLVENSCNKLLKKGFLFRSPFYIPNKIKDKTGNMSRVFGLNTVHVMKGVFKLMPKAVYASFILIQHFR